MIYFQTMKNYSNADATSYEMMSVRDMCILCDPSRSIHLGADTMSELRALACYLSDDADYFVIKSQDTFYAFITAELLGTDEVHGTVNELNIVSAFDRFDYAVLSLLSQLAIDSADEGLEHYLRVKNGTFDL